MNAKDENNQNVDWWFIYKTPDKTGPSNNNGDAYFYFDANSSKLELSQNRLNQKSGALHNTLNTAFDSSNGDLGYIVYNDERTDGGKNKESRGHCKGVLIFSKSDDTACMLLHSVPRFTAPGETTLPEDEHDYGQTFLCITLGGYSAANTIARQMLRQQNPQVLTSSSFLPKNVKNTEPLSQLYHETHVEESTKPSDIKLVSKAGHQFTLIAKSRKWGQDFWVDLVGPKLGVDLDVESWRRKKAIQPGDDPNKVEDVADVSFESIGFNDYKWSYTKDHSKWAVAASDDDAPWVCVGDINRMTSQEKRGGGAICFEEATLWSALHSTVTLASQPQETATTHDSGSSMDITPVPEASASTSPISPNDFHAVHGTDASAANTTVSTEPQAPDNPVPMPETVPGPVAPGEPAVTAQNMPEHPPVAVPTAPPANTPDLTQGSATIPQENENSFEEATPQGTEHIVHDSAQGAVYANPESPQEVYTSTEPYYPAEGTVENTENYEEPQPQPENEPQYNSPYN